LNNTSYNKNASAFQAKTRNTNFSRFCTRIHTKTRKNAPNIKTSLKKNYSTLMRSNSRENEGEGMKGRIVGGTSWFNGRNKAIISGLKI